MLLNVPDTQYNTFLHDNYAELGLLYATTLEMFRKCLRVFIPSALPHARNPIVQLTELLQAA